MSVLGALYQIIIGSLELLFEVVYQFFYKEFQNPGLAIIPVSIVISSLCLPLYIKADKLKKENEIKEKEMEPMVKHIKKHFHGDERYMMLHAYYRVEHYNPVYTLKNSFSLLLQIPFFIAAYHFLSNLKSLDGVSFGLVSNLGAPDALLKIGGLSVNVLPILMTLVNILSGVFYLKGKPLKDKVQLYGIALLFLLLLYRSPAGLVFYWLLNNVYSLIKNFVLSRKDSKKAFRKLMSGLGVLTFFVAVVMYVYDGYWHGWTLVLAVLLEFPFLKNLLEKRSDIRLEGFEYKKSDKVRFILGGCVLTVLTGYLIPSAVISSSPMEFVVLTDYYSPLVHLAYSCFLAFGFFIVWFGLFYYLAEERVKSIYEMILCIAVGIAFVNYMAFGTKMGTLSPLLQYKNELNISFAEQLINEGVCLTIAILLFLLWLKKNELVKRMFVLLLLVTVGMSVKNTAVIGSQIPKIQEAVANLSETTPTLRLSKTGKNVVVLVLDKAVSGFVPYIFNEKPELADQFEGFVWYPNTISYGNMTNVGSPGLYGGYEYTPEEMNKRSDEWLGDKQNEALKLMPVLFDEAGFEVTVCDPPYAGYQFIPDLSIYDDHPNIRAFQTGGGVLRFTSSEYLESREALWRRNFFCYSIMKSMPLICQDFLYQGGSYFYSDATSLMQLNLGDGEEKSVGGQEEFMNAYAVLDRLADITEITDDSTGAFVMMHNHTTHEPVLLQEPDYIPQLTVDNAEYDEVHKDRFHVNGKELSMKTPWRIKHYHVNMAAMIQIGEWLDYLREQGLYDNTRIIIVADHGAALGCFEDLVFGEEDYADVMYYNPLLMVKDFDSKTAFHENDEFMTNADTPVLAFEDLIEEPVNPYTGHMINSDKKRGSQHILFTEDWQIDKNNGNTFLPGEWLEVVNENIFDVTNWVDLGNY